MRSRFTLSLQINNDAVTSIAVPTIYDSTELGFTKVTTTDTYLQLIKVHATNNNLSEFLWILEKLFPMLCQG